VCPVSALPALRHGTAARLVLAAAPCLLANLLDLAAGTVPVTTVEAGEESGRASSTDPIEREAREADRGSAGLPVGVQVIALRRRPIEAETLLLEVMGAMEGARSPDR
jgi:fatty acid amide hydrolase